MYGKISPKIAFFSVILQCEKMEHRHFMGNFTRKLTELNISLGTLAISGNKLNKKAVLPQGNCTMPQVFFSVEVRQQHFLQV